MNKLDDPVNHTEKYLYGINVRLEVLIDQVSSLLSHISKTQGVTLEENTVEQVKPTRTRKG
jgi:hypothetical protein